MRNRATHDGWSDPALWAQAAAALRPLVGWLGAGGPVQSLTESELHPEPFFLLHDGQWRAFNGIDQDGVVYVAPNGAAEVSAAGLGRVLLLFQRVLGQTAEQEENFRKWLGRLAPEEVKGVLLGDFLVGRPVGRGEGPWSAPRAYSLDGEDWLPRLRPDRPGQDLDRPGVGGRPHLGGVWARLRLYCVNHCREVPPMPQTAETFYLAFAQGREPESDEPEMESSLHYDQLALLVSTLDWYWRDRDDFFIGANLSVYFRRDQFAARELRGPDFFLVRGVQRRPRRSWTVWLEDGRYPDLIIELLSDETARTDRTAKKALYEGVFRTPEYFWFSPDTQELAGFHLVDGRYYPIDPDAAGRLPSVILGLRLGVAEGLLRFFTPAGVAVPTLAESVALEQARAEVERQRAEEERQHAGEEARRAEQQRQRAEQQRERAEREHANAVQAHTYAEQEKRRADTERERADRLAERLRALGVDPAAD